MLAVPPNHNCPDRAAIAHVGLIVPPGEQWSRCPAPDPMTPSTMDNLICCLLRTHTQAVRTCSFRIGESTPALHLSHSINEGPTPQGLLEPTCRAVWSSVSRGPLAVPHGCHGSQWLLLWIVGTPEDRPTALGWTGPLGNGRLYQMRRTIGIVPLQMHSKPTDGRQNSIQHWGFISASHINAAVTLMDRNSEKSVVLFLQQDQPWRKEIHTACY